MYFSSKKYVFQKWRINRKKISHFFFKPNLFKCSKVYGVLPQYLTYFFNSLKIVDEKILKFHHVVIILSNKPSECQNLLLYIKLQTTADYIRVIYVESPFAIERKWVIWMKSTWYSEPHNHFINKMHLFLLPYKLLLWCFW